MPQKTARVLHFLYEGGSLNRFQAAAMLHDTCLNSTISAIRNGYEVPVNGKSETVQGYKGIATVCNRYWLNSSSSALDKAFLVLTRRFGYKPVA